MTNPFPPGAQVAAYLRDSGGDRQQFSTAQQEAALRAWCADHAIILSAVFRDDARPGSSTIGRAGFTAMLDHFRHSPPEAGLVIWSYSRFARDIDDAQFHRADLRRRGYLLHSISDDIPDGPIGKLFEAVIDWKNEQFLNDLSHDVKRGLSALVLQHGAVPGTPPRGFMRAPVDLGRDRSGKPRRVHRWAPDPALTPLIRQAFEMKAAGASLAQIHAATGLYNSLNSYTSFFSNQIYRGTLRFGEHIIQNYCEPLIDELTWGIVQAQLTASSARFDGATIPGCSSLTSLVANTPLTIFFSRRLPFRLSSPCSQPGNLAHQPVN